MFPSAVLHNSHSQTGKDGELDLEINLDTLAMTKWERVVFAKFLKTGADSHIRADDESICRASFKGNSVVAS